MKKAITVIAALVAVLAFTSGAFAAKQYMITSSKQIKKGAISLSNLSRHAHLALQGAAGATGATGPTGPAGPAGPAGHYGATGATGPTGRGGVAGRDGLTGPQGLQGPAGVAGAAGAAGPAGPQGLVGPQGPKGDNGLAGAYYSVAYYDVGNTNGGALATVACKAQTDTAISGGVSTDDYMKTVPVGQSFPGRMNWTTNTPKPDRLDGWIVQFATQNGSAPERVKVWALCVPGLNVPVHQTYTQSIDG